MNHLDIENLDDLAKLVLSNLDLPDKGITLQDLIRKVEIKSNRSIHIEGLNLRPNQSGEVELLGDSYMIRYNRTIKGRLLILVVLHELVHILLKDPEKSTLACRIYDTSALPITLKLYRNESVENELDQHEMSVEYIAKCLREKVIWKKHKVGWLGLL